MGHVDEVCCISAASDNSMEERGNYAVGIFELVWRPYHAHKSRRNSNHSQPGDLAVRIFFFRPDDGFVLLLSFYLHISITNK